MPKKREEDFLDEWGDIDHKGSQNIGMNSSGGFGRGKTVVSK